MPALQQETGLWARVPGRGGGRQEASLGGASLSTSARPVSCALQPRPSPRSACLSLTAGRGAARLWVSGRELQAVEAAGPPLLCLVLTGDLAPCSNPSATSARLHPWVCEGQGALRGVSDPLWSGTRRAVPPVGSFQGTTSVGVRVPQGKGRLLSTQEPCHVSARDTCSSVAVGRQRECGCVWQDRPALHRHGWRDRLFHWTVGPSGFSPPRPLPMGLSGSSH